MTDDEKDTFILDLWDKFAEIEYIYLTTKELKEITNYLEDKLYP